MEGQGSIIIKQVAHMATIAHLRTSEASADDAPGALPIWTPGAWLAESIKGITKHCYTQHIKNLNLLVSEKKIFFFNFPIVILWELMTPGCIRFGPYGYDWQNLCRVPLNIHVTGFRPCGFREEDFFMLFTL